MSRVEVVSAWEETVSRELPQLSRPQARVLALWSLGIALAQRCGQTSVAVTLAALLGVREGSMRQRLREWRYAAADKRGAKRRALEVEGCFTPLLGWVLRWWAPDAPPSAANPATRRLALALDATTLGTRFTVLALCVVYRSSAVPVAWVVVRAATPGAWRPHWERLLARMAASVPPAWTVLVVADRGLYAPWLFDAITARGWHPGLRLNGGNGGNGANGGASSGLYRLPDSGGWRTLRSLLPQPGTAWCGYVICFREWPVAGTLLARWEAGYAEGWLVLTDLPPDGADVAWYGLRAWVEGGFKDLKRDGWQWQRTRMDDPQRAARLWLALAVATLWMLGMGGAAEDALPIPSKLTALPARHIARRTACGRPAPRMLSCFRRGLAVLLAAAMTSRTLPRACFVSTPWPTSRPTSWHPKTYP